MSKSGASFNPASDIPTLTGKVVFITGGTTGLGAASILALAAHSPAHIFFSGRNANSASSIISRAKSIAPSVPVTFISIDNSSFASVSAGAKDFLAQSARLDILILNAGIMAASAATSADGYELQFATNHLGHALLTKLLLPALLSQESSNPRIVSLSSSAYSLAPSCGIDFSTLKSSQSSLGLPLLPGRPWSRYGQSKLANMLYARSIAERYPQLTSVAVHPGIVSTGLFENVTAAAKPLAMVVALFGSGLSADEGCHNQLWAATSEKVVSGEFYNPVGVAGLAKGNKWIEDKELGRKLWEWTQEIIEAF